MIKKLYPSFFYLLPITGQKVQIRSMLSHEEKVLLYAKESNEKDEMFDAIVQVTQNCLMNDLDVLSLCMADLLALYLKIRSLSISNMITVEYRDNDDGSTHEFDIDLDKIVPKLGSKPKKLMIDENTSILLKYPTATIKDFTVIDCIDSVFNGDEKIDFSKESKEDQQTFLEDLPLTINEEVLKFAKKAPYLYYKIEYQNQKKQDRKVELNTFEDFFILSMTNRSLKNYLQMNFHFSKRTPWDINSLENLTPFERDTYLDFIIAEDKKNQLATPSAMTAPNPR